MKKEIWKVVKSSDGFLQVSNLGNVREYVETILNGKSIVYMNRKIYTTIKKNGKTNSVVFFYKNKYYYLKRIVAEAFLDDFSHNKYIRFKDGNIENIIPENLELMCNGFKYSYGENNIKAKINDDDVLNICKLILDGYNYKIVSKKYNIHHNNIHRILRKEIWKHIDRPYISLREISTYKKYNKIKELLNKN